jgi:hypothetical protein
VKDGAGKTVTLVLNEHLVVDSGVSVMGCRGYDPHRGNHVVVTYAQAGDKSSAVFVRSRE